MNRTTAKGMLRYAKDYCDAAYQVCEPPKIVRDKLRFLPSIPVYYLLGHSIELSLKAFLLFRGESITALRSRKYGHNLCSLLKESNRRKLGLIAKLSRQEKFWIQVLNTNYMAKQFEYVEYGAKTLPPYDELYTIASNLIMRLTQTLSNQP